MKGTLADDSGASEIFSHAIPAAIAAGESAAFAVETGPLAPGKRTLRVQIALAGGAPAGNDRDSLRIRVGAGPLAVTEIQFHPGAGEGEWVEVKNRDALPLDIAGFRLSDRGASHGVPAGGSGALAPDSLALLAQDRAAFADLSHDQAHIGFGDPVHKCKVLGSARLNVGGNCFHRRFYLA